MLAPAASCHPCCELVRPTAPLSPWAKSYETMSKVNISPLAVCVRHSVTAVRELRDISQEKMHHPAIFSPSSPSSFPSSPLPVLPSPSSSFSFIYKYELMGIKDENSGCLQQVKSVISQFCWALWEMSHLFMPFFQHLCKAVYRITSYHEVTRAGVVQEAGFTQLCTAELIFGPWPSEHNFLPSRPCIARQTLDSYST